MRYYVLDETQLENLIRGFFRYRALDKGGVVNWEWFNQSLSDYYKQLTMNLVEQNALTLRAQQHLSTIDAEDFVIQHTLQELGALGSIEEEIC